MSETAFIARSLKPYANKRYIPLSHIAEEPGRSFVNDDDDYNSDDGLREYYSSTPQILPNIEPSSTQILRLDVHCESPDVKRSFFKDLYAMYDYDYINHPPYGPTAARMSSPDHTYNDVDDIVDKYLGYAVYGNDITQPKPPPLCPCCRSVNQQNARHGSKHALSSRNRPYIPDTQPDVLRLPSLPSNSPPTSSRTTSHYKSVRFDETVDIQRYTPEQTELQSESQALPVYGERTDKRKFYVTRPQMLNFFTEFGMDERTPVVRKKTDELLTASVKYTDAMDRLGRKLKLFEN